LALPTGVINTVAEQESYQYAFSAQDLAVNIFQNDPSAVQIEGGEAWILPEVVPETGVVGRFAVAMQIHNAIVLYGSSDQPVTGNLRYQYNLYEVYEDGVNLPNIALPNGC
jgi:hypothetical protein